MKLSARVYGCVLLLLVSGGFVGCSSSGDSELTTQPTAEQASVADAPGPNRTACERPLMYDSMVPKSASALIRESGAIIVGTVGGQRVTRFNERPTEPHRPLPPPTTWISPDGVNVQLPPDDYGERGELPPTTFDLGTDSEVRIDRLLSGSVGSTAAFTLRNHGDGHLYCDLMDPIAESGQQYVFFLGRAGWEATQPPNGVWLAIGGLTGRYRLDGDRLRADRSPSARYIAELDGITLSELEQMILR